MELYNQMEGFYRRTKLKAHFLRHSQTSKPIGQKIRI